MAPFHVFSHEKLRTLSPKRADGTLPSDSVRAKHRIGGRVGWTDERFTVVHAGDGLYAFHNPRYNRHVPSQHKKALAEASSGCTVPWEPQGVM